MDAPPFPRIEHLDDVLPHISYELGFVVSRRADHTVIDYVYATDATFASPVARECRGLKFDSEGRLIARPLHKFFNLGEKEQVGAIDWSQPHVALDKLDGSMIHPVRLGGQLVMMTRMGATGQAALASSHAGPAVIRLCNDLLDAGITPVFEFTSPDNRIVVAYDRPTITLLAARGIVSGTYLTHAQLEDLGARYGVPVAGSRGRVEDPAGFVAEARSLPHIEGFVVAFDSGHRIKLKTDGYVLRHKAISGLAHEKNVLAWVAAGAVDDVLPLLSPQLGRAVRAYQDSVLAGLGRLSGQIAAFVEANRALPRRDFAARVMASLDPRLRGAAFAALDGRDPTASLMASLEAATRSATAVDAIRDLIGMHWDTATLHLPEIET
jgi:RNA ligase